MARHARQIVLLACTLSLSVLLLAHAAGCAEAYVDQQERETMAELDRQEAAAVAAARKRREALDKAVLAVNQKLRQAQLDAEFEIQNLDAAAQAIQTELTTQLDALDTTRKTTAADFEAQRERARMLDGLVIAGSTFLPTGIGTWIASAVRNGRKGYQEGKASGEEGGMQYAAFHLAKAFEDARRQDPTFNGLLAGATGEKIKAYLETAAPAVQEYVNAARKRGMTPPEVETV